MHNGPDMYIFFFYFFFFEKKNCIDYCLSLNEICLNSLNTICNTITRIYSYIIYNILLYASYLYGYIPTTCTYILYLYITLYYLSKLKVKSRSSRSVVTKIGAKAICTFFFIGFNLFVTPTPCSLHIL